MRSSVLRAWRDSPTRLTEDTNAEHDLRVGGYRDRLFTELAQNAADAAAQAGTPGRLRVTVTDGELRVANTGAPLDSAGVASLASLRASAKREGNVGRFGVGFAAVLTVTSEPRIVSRTGGVAFSEARTREAVGRGGDVPILRLPWPLPDAEPAPPEGFDTEVRLPLRVDAAAVLDGIRAEVPDVLLALPWLAEIDVEGQRWTRSAEGDVVELGSPDGRSMRWLTHAGDGCVWAVPVGDDGTPQPLRDDLLRVPTPTDERVSLPARLFVSVPVEPSRRRVLPGAETRRVLADAARAYPGLVRLLPVPHRLAVVPGAGFPLSDIDGLLRDLVTRSLSEQAWLPSAEEPEAGGSAGGPEDRAGELPGERARVLTLDTPELTGLLAAVIPGLVAAPLCGRAASRTLAGVGANPVGVADLVEAVTGIERDPSWWYALYGALLRAVDRHEVDLDELGALPVPLADGRTVPGPRGALVLADVDLVANVDVAGLHVVHPDAAHPLLERLGAVAAGPGELLAAPALRDAVERSAEDALAGVDVLPLVTTVLRLVSLTGADGPRALALPARGGGWRRADELVLPGSELLDVLDPDAIGDDAPLDVLDPAFASRWPSGVLTSVGVLDGFVVASGSEAAGAEPDGAEEGWTDEDELPIRDLDLVADGAWPAAVRLLAARPATWHALSAPDGRVRRWLARHALLADRPPQQWRLPSAHRLAGLFDPVPDVGLDERLLTAIGVRTDLALADGHDADVVCDRLADPDRTVPPGLALRAHAALAQVPPDDVEPPAAVRTLAGGVCPAEDAAVLDAPWLLAVWAPDRLVAVPDYEDAPALADVLDLPLAGDETSAEVTSEGEFAAWSDLPAVVDVADLLGVDLPDGGVVMHDELVVGSRPVPWWYDGALHASDTSDGLGRAFAWAARRWPDRALIIALLDDPDPRTVLG